MDLNFSNCCRKKQCKLKHEGVQLVEGVDFSCQWLSMETPRQTDLERVQELIQKEAHVCGVIHTHIK